MVWRTALTPVAMRPVHSLGGESGAGDVAVLTEMLLDYGDTGSLPPLAEFTDLPDPLDPSRHEPVEPPEPVEPTNAAELSGALLDEPMETPVGGLGNAAARGTSITLAMQCVRFALQFCSLVVLARLLTPSDFGIVAMVTAIVGVADILRDFGLSSAAIQAKTLNNLERSNLFWVNVGIGCAGALVILLCTPLIQPPLRPAQVGADHLLPCLGSHHQWHQHAVQRGAKSQPALQGARVCRHRCAGARCRRGDHGRRPRRWVLGDRRAADRRGRHDADLQRGRLPVAPRAAETRQYRSPGSSGSVAAYSVPS